MPNLRNLLRKRPSSSTSGAYLSPQVLEAASNAYYNNANKSNFMEEIPEIFQLPALDRGKWTAQQEMERAQQATLVEGGRKAGKSRVHYFSPRLRLVLFSKDFFISAINQKTHVIFGVVFLLYVFLSFFWSIPYYLIMRFEPGCIYGATHYVEIWIYAFITMATIGYGNTGPQACWSTSVVISVQSIFSLLLEAVVIGIIFARISHPKQRGRSIFISDSAVISRRDGILKFMFRVADVRKTQVVDPKIKAYLYTWGDGRITAEGERVPVRCEALEIGYIDGMLILPLIIEHTIDELSPLCGHTHDSLQAMNAELVITFEGTTEFGNPFMARRSFVPTDIFWGYQFVDIIVRPAPGETRYSIDLNRFHDIVPQAGLPPLPASALSRLVTNRAKRTVPYPLLGDNTLVVSDTMCLYRDEAGRLCLAARVADTYPNQMIEITAKMHLYRWAAPGSDPSFECIPLECGYKTGEDRLYLRLPMELTHVIDEASPLAAWLQGEEGRAADADSEVVVMLTGYMFSTGSNILRQRTYSVLNHIKMDHRFVPIVRHPELQADKKPVVRWARFHDVASTDPKARALRTAMTQRQSFRQQSPDNPSPPAPGAASAAAASLARASPGLGFSPLDAANDFTVSPIDLARYAAMVTAAGDNTLTRGAGGRREFPPIPDFQSIVDEAGADPATRHALRMLPSIAKYTLTTFDAADSLPHRVALHPAMPGASRFRGMMDDEEEDMEEVGDDLGEDLARYELDMQGSEGGKDGAGTGVATADAWAEPEAGPSDLGPVAAAVEASASSQPEASGSEATEERGGGSPSAVREDELGLEAPASGRAPILQASSPSAGGEDASSPVALIEEEVEPGMLETPGSGGSLRLLGSRTFAPSFRSQPERDEATAEEDAGEDAEEANAGPIHFNTPSSWSQTRALTNLFGAPPSPAPQRQQPEGEDSESP
ncbi:IRK1B [Auxenochlorella protothecoides x Auxenochlorella symbiontica]